MTLAHGELDAVTALLERGYPMTAPIAAALGRAGELRELLAAGGDAQIALAQAVINDRADTARVALEHGADANAFMAVHAHSVPLHQAALHDDVELLALLVEHGARTDVRDTIWNGTPLGWARHEQRPRAAAYLESLA
jgi:peptide-methionine (S)-S-oxide reductase